MEIEVRRRMVEAYRNSAWITRLLLSRFAERTAPSNFVLWLQHDFFCRERISHSYGVVRLQNDIALRRRLLRVPAFLFFLLVGVLIAIVAGILIYPHSHDGQARLQELISIDECAQAVEVLDQKGSVGRIPLSIHRPVPCKKAKEAGWRPHQTSFLADVPLPYRRMLTSAEDRRSGKWYLLNLRGIDIPGLAVGAVGALRGKMTRGGSTPSTQSSRMLRGLAPRKEESDIEKIWRKVTEVLDAITLTPAIGGVGSEGFFRLVARNLPCSQGTSSSGIGGTVYGLKDCARILFNHEEVADLSVAEIAIIVAANNYPVLFAPEHHEKEQKVARDRRQEVINRALQVIDLTYEKNDPLVEGAKAQIRAMHLLEPKLPRRFRRRLGDDPKKILEVGGNPSKRITEFAHGESTQALGELADAFRSDGSGKAIRGELNSLRFTLDIAANWDFKVTVEQILRDEERKRGGRLKLALTPTSSRRESSSSASTALLKPAEVHLSLVDNRGQVVRHYSRSEDTIWAGSQTKRDENGRYQLHREDRHLGSTVKPPSRPGVGEESPCLGSKSPSLAGMVQ